MPYDPTVWVNDVTALDAVNLNNIEQAISTLVDMELAHVESTTGVNITAMAESAADTWITLPELTFDGNTWVWLEAFAPAAYSTTSLQMEFIIHDGPSLITYPMEMYFPPPGGGANAQRVFFRVRLKPTAGAHTYSVRAYLISAGLVTIYGQAGGHQDYTPAYFRCERIHRST